MLFYWGEKNGSPKKQRPGLSHTKMQRNQAVFARFILTFAS
jgi:hypothetical protein